jgi:hypothetical protein
MTTLPDQKGQARKAQQPQGEAVVKKDIVGGLETDWDAPCRAKMQKIPWNSKLPITLTGTSTSTASTASHTPGADAHRVSHDTTHDTTNDTTHDTHMTHSEHSSEAVLFGGQDGAARRDSQHARQEDQAAHLHPHQEEHLLRPLPGPAQRQLQERRTHPISPLSPLPLPQSPGPTLTPCTTPRRRSSTWRCHHWGTRPSPNLLRGGLLCPIDDCVLTPVVAGVGATARAGSR